MHTNTDLKVYRFVLLKTHQLIHVHTTVFIAFTAVNTNTPRIRFEVDFPSMYGCSSSLSFSKDGWDILKFSFRSSGTTVCETKLSHHALVHPGRIQNHLALASHVFSAKSSMWGPRKSYIPHKNHSPSMGDQ